MGQRLDLIYYIFQIDHQKKNIIFFRSDSVRNYGINEGGFGPAFVRGKSTFSSKTQKKQVFGQRFLRNCVFKNAKNNVLKPEALLSFFENTIFYTQITFLHHTFFRVSITKIPSNIWSNDKLSACRISPPLRSRHISEQAAVTMENVIATKKKSHIYTPVSLESP